MPRREPTDAVPPPPLSRGRRRHTTPFLPRGPASIGAASATVRLSRQKPASDRHAKVTATVTDQPSRVAAVRHRNSWRAEEGGSPLESSPRGWSFPAKTPAAPAPHQCIETTDLSPASCLAACPPHIDTSAGALPMANRAASRPHPAPGSFEPSGPSYAGECMYPPDRCAGGIAGWSGSDEGKKRTYLPAAPVLPVFFLCANGRTGLPAAPTSHHAVND